MGWNDDSILAWAMLPQTKGAKYLYDHFLKDFLKKNESRVDAALADAKKSAGSMASELSSAGAELVGAAANAMSDKKDT
jgi:hypothetical protein